MENNNNNNNNNNDNDKVSINEKEAKKQFFEELKSKNLEEKKKLEELKKKKLEEKKKKAELKKKEAEEKKKQEELRKKELKENKQQEKSESKKVTSEELKELGKGKDDFSKEEAKKPGKSLNINQKLKSSFIDTIVTGVVSAAALYLFDILLRLLFGYYVADMKGMFIIIFFIVLVLYPFIMDKTKYKTTLGDKFGKQ